MEKVVYLIVILQISMLCIFLFSNEARFGHKPWSSSTQITDASTGLVLERSDPEWHLSLSPVMHYTYPIHRCLAFLSSSGSLAATLNLLLLRFLGRQYAEVCALARACISDATFSCEERQIFNNLEYLNADCHPSGEVAS